jgi:hypothetical protein
VFGNSRNFTKLWIDPLDPTHVIATASTLNVTRATETRDGGVSFFTTFGNALPNVPVHTILAVPGAPNSFMVGTDYGVLLTTNGGGSWTQGPPGLPTTIVHDLAYAPSTGTIFASTFGRGAWAIRPGNTPAVRRGDVDNDGLLTAQDAMTIQQAVVGFQPPPGRTLYPNGDANCDGVLSSVDAMLVLRSAVGLSTTGCVGTLARPAEAPGAGIDPGTHSVIRGLASGQ